MSFVSGVGNVNPEVKPELLNLMMTFDKIVQDESIKADCGLLMRRIGDRSFRSFLRQRSVHGPMKKEKRNALLKIG